MIDEINVKCDFLTDNKLNVKIDGEVVFFSIELNSKSIEEGKLFVVPSREDLKEIKRIIEGSQSFYLECSGKEIKELKEQYFELIEQYNQVCDELKKYKEVV
jgi:hypothetical protein